MLSRFVLWCFDTLWPSDGVPVIPRGPVDCSLPPVSEWPSVCGW